MASCLRIRMLLHKIRARFDIVIDEQQHIAQRSRHRRILRSRDAHPFQPKVPHLNRRSIWQHDCVDRLAAVRARAIQRNDHFKRTAVIQLLFAQVRQQPAQRFRTTTGRYNDADMWSQNRLPRPDLQTKTLTNNTHRRTAPSASSGSSFGSSAVTPIGWTHNATSADKPFSTIY